MSIKSIMTAAVFGMAATAAVACPDENSDGQQYVYLEEAFMPDPFVVSVATGTGVDLGACRGDWLGEVSRTATVEVYYEGGGEQLTFAFERDSDVDAVMMIYGASGVVFSDDVYDLDPVITFDDPEAGTYMVWIGSVEGARGMPGRLLITEMNY